MILPLLSMLPIIITYITGANQLFDIPDDLKSVVSEHWAQFPPQELTFYSLDLSSDASAIHPFV